MYVISTEQEAMSAPAAKTWAAEKQLPPPPPALERPREPQAQATPSVLASQPGWDDIASATYDMALWTAVMNGDAATLRQYGEAGRLSPALRDSNGHSLLWDAVAFGHAALARVLLGLVQGWDLSEVHPRRGDTLLHLVANIDSFSAEHAELFKELVAKVGLPVITHRNAQGYTFAHVAAARPNFWVLRYILHSQPRAAREVLCLPDATTQQARPLDF